MKKTNALFALVLIAIAACFIAQTPPVGKDTRILTDSVFRENQRGKIKEQAEDIHNRAREAYDTDNMMRAFSGFDSALILRLPALDAQDKDIARNYIMLGMTARELGRYVNSDVFLQKAFDCLEKRQNPNDAFLWVTACQARGNVLIDLGDYSKAQLYLEKGLTFNADESDKAILYDLLGTVLMKLNKPELALIDYKKAIVCNQLAKETPNLAKNYVNIGTAYKSLKHNDSAIVAINKARVYFNQYKTKTSDVYLDIANADNELGHIYLALKQYDKANQYYQLAYRLAIKQGSQAAAHLAEAMTGLGHIAYQKGDKKTALRQYHAATGFLIPEFSQTATTDTPSVKSPISEELKAIDALILRGKVLRELAQKKNIYQDVKTNSYLKVARHNYKLLDSLINRICYNYSEDNTKYALINKTNSVYEAALSLALQCNDTIAALHYANCTKGFVLKTLLFDKRIKQIADVSAKDLAYEKDLQIDMAYWYKKMLTNKNQLAQDSIYALYFKAKRTYDTWTDSLSIKCPKYAQLKKQNVIPLSIATIKSRLKDSMAYVEYVVGEDSIYTIMMSKQQTVIQNQALPKGFKDTFNLFRQSFTTDESATHDTRQANFKRLSLYFYQLLLQDPLSKINQNQAIHRLRIVPDGYLGYLPFALLLTDSATSWRPQEQYQPAFLIQKYALSYDYSRELMFDSTVYHTLSIEKPAHKLGVFGIQYDDLTLSLMQNVGKSLEKLTNSPIEARKIQAQIGGDVFTDDNNQQLSKSLFLEKIKSRYGILHLSMHAAMNDNDPLSSALIFSKKDSLDDNLWSVSDIYAAQFNHNDLTVLSACQTADGQLQRGEGIMSLARAFALGGCKSVIATLWSVGSNEMYQLMPLFYGHLKTGIDKDLALQATQKECLQNNTFQRHFIEPNKWAASILIGNIEGMAALSEADTWIWTLLSALFIGLFIGLSYMWLRKKKGE